MLSLTSLVIHRIVGASLSLASDSKSKIPAIPAIPNRLLTVPEDMMQSIFKFAPSTPFGDIFPE